MSKEERDRYEELALRISLGRAVRKEVMEYLELQKRVLSGE